MELFEQTNKVKYKNDLWEYVFESSVEDFCDLSGADVVVSTIHKAKGHEFDNVYMLIDGIYKESDEILRRYYVGITRAKKNLYIHTNKHFLEGWVRLVMFVKNNILCQTKLFCNYHIRT